jgi:hypothetical protein
MAEIRYLVTSFICVPHMVGSVFEPIRFLLPVCWLCWFVYTWTYMHIFRRIFLSNYWWQKYDIWSQASYRYPISWEALLDPSDSYFLFADLLIFTFNAHFSSHFSKQLLMTAIWYLVTSFIYVCHIVGSVLGPIRFILSVCRLCFYSHWTYILYMPIFSRIFLSNYWWQKSDIWSQASYRYSISWEAFFDLSDSYFLFAEERGYHKWPLAHSSSCSF